MENKNSGKLSKAVVMVSLLAAAHSAFATPITIPILNSSFEANVNAVPPVTGNKFNGFADDWIISGAFNQGGSWNPSGAKIGFLAESTAISGVNVGFLNLGSMHQIVIPGGLLPQHDYTLSIDLFARTDFAGAVAKIVSPTDYAVSLRVGAGLGDLITPYSFAGTGTNGVMPTAGNWITFTTVYHTYNTVRPGPVSIWIENFNTTSVPARQFDFDNVRLTTEFNFINPAPVPDGGSVTWIVGLGLGAFACFNRSRKTSK